MLNLLVLAIDGLQPASLGPYGNTWIPTPNWNRLAERSLMLERCWADSPRLENIYRALWSGRPGWAAQRAASKPAAPSLPALLQASGRMTLLLSDDPAVADFPSAEKFDEQIIVPLPERDTACADWTETALAEFFATGASALDELAAPFAAWWHCGSLGKLWDAPYEYRARLADEDDPPPPEHVHPPYGAIPPGTDPDVLLGERQAAAAQTVVLDECLGAFLDEWDASPLAKTTLLVVCSTRGFPLGEQARWGWSDDCLTRECLHQAMFICAPDAAQAGERSMQFAQPHDLRTNIAARLGLTSEKPAAWWDGPAWSAFDEAGTQVRDRMFFGARDAQGIAGIATESWRLLSESDSERPARLYFQPDDYFEINDVADRRADVVEELETQLRAWRDRVRTGDETTPLPALAEAATVD